MWLAIDLDSQPKNLTGWIHYFESYFQYPNRSTTSSGCRSLLDFTDRLAELGGYITSSKHQRGEAFYKYYAKYFAWYCGLVAQIQVQFEDAVWVRFPEKCPYCGQLPCAFLYNPALRMHALEEPDQFRIAASNQLQRSPSVARKSLANWLEHFVRIYPTNLHHSIGSVVERFHEEQSELFKELRQAQRHRDSTGAITSSEIRERVVEELSDLFSWFLALGAKVLLEVRNDKFLFVRSSDPTRFLLDFDLLVFSMYRDGCEKCHQKPCHCEPSSPVDRSDLAADEIVEPVPFGEDKEIYEVLVNEQVISLSDYKVVGNFVVYDPELRSSLIKAVNELRLRAEKAKDPIPVLLCANPGSGKTFFVNEYARELGLGPHEVVRLMLAPSDDIAASLRMLYKQIVARKELPRVAFLDEVDTQIAGEYAYRYLLSAMLGDSVDVGDGLSCKLPSVVWFFAASTASNVEDFEKTLKTIGKGPDFLRRFNQAGMTIQLPGVSSSFEVLLQAVATAKAMNPNIAYIDASVLYYFAISTWKDAGELKAAVRRAIDASQGGVLDATVLRSLDFESKHHQSLRVLGKRLVKIK
jgi:hypothetical protein